MSIEDLKLKIKEEILISQIVGNYVVIKKQGTNMVALCPFHSDTKPSLHISDSKKMFMCFTCKVGGDAISFVQKYRQLEFIDALKEICQKQGLHFDSFSEKYNSEKMSNPKLEMAYKVLEKTATLYKELADTHHYGDYESFIKDRGLSIEVANTYGLGFAPPKNSLLDFLSFITDEKERDFALEVAIELGLIKQSKSDLNIYYDTFRERVIFPVWDERGNVLGFTSRSVRVEQIPKYMNSAESFMFKKQNILYGLHLAEKAIKLQDAVILVEGNMDQIALFQAGFKNTVAVMGVALGPQSLERLLGLTKNIYLALDTDNAGFHAMTRINSQFAEFGIVTKYLEFSPLKDPDDFLKVVGAVAFQKKLDEALPAFDILLDKLIPEIIPEVVDKKLSILNQVFEVMAPLGQNLAATERVVLMARRLGLQAGPDQIIKTYSEYLDNSKGHKI